MIFPLQWTLAAFPENISKQIWFISNSFSQNQFYPIDFVIKQFTIYLPSNVVNISSLFYFYLSTMAINPEKSTKSIENLMIQYRVPFYIYLLKIMYSISQKQNSQLKFYEFYREMRGQSNSLLLLDHYQNYGTSYGTRADL
jgi:ABC-type multidrug transport system permease subunit